MTEYLLILVLHAAGTTHKHELQLHRLPDLDSCYAYGLAKQEMGGADRFHCIPVQPAEQES